MRFKAGVFWSLVLGAFFFTVAGCKPTPIKLAVPTYSYVNPIVNPPDTFQVAYDLNLQGNRTALITFQDSAVWYIQIMTQSQATFGFINPTNHTTVFLNGNDTLGFRSGIAYSFVVNNGTADTLSGLYFVKFTRLPQLDYSSFYRKY